MELVLMDFSKPDMDAYQTTQSIHQSASLWKFPVITLATRAISVERARCLEANTNDVG